MAKTSRVLDAWRVSKLFAKQGARHRSKPESGPCACGATGRDASCGLRAQDAGWRSPKTPDDEAGAQEEERHALSFAFRIHGGARRRGARPARGGAER